MYNRTDVLALVRSAMENDEGTDEHLLSLEDHALSKMIFHMPIAEDDNLRLSRVGYEYLKQAFEYFEIMFPEDYLLTTRDLLFLSERCICPYYVSSKDKLYGIFEEELATHLTLVGGNLSNVM